MPNPVVHWEMGSADAGKLAGFYKDLFGWHSEAVPGENPYELVDTHTESGINGGIAQSTEHPGVVVYVEVDDLGAYLKKAEGLGGKTILEPQEMEMVTFALFADPDGHILGLVKSEQEGS